jgi:hypothetical protein
VVDKASSSITIDADKHAIMAVIADFEAYPDWSTAIKQVSVDEVGDDGRGTTATFTLDLPARRRPERAHARHVQAQGREDDHGHGAEGAQEAGGVRVARRCASANP